MNYQDEWLLYEAGDEIDETYDKMVKNRTENVSDSPGAMTGSSGNVTSAQKKPQRIR